MRSIVDFNLLKSRVNGLAVPRATSGTLSGHAAGEPFDKAVCAELLKMYPGKVFRQYEYLNTLFSKHLDAVGLKARNSLIKSPTVLFLLSRGKNAMEQWSLDSQFEEKQNDTADILVVDDDTFNLIDIKTRNITKKAQPPNIISSYKLAQLCARMIDNAEFDTFTMDYFGVDWVLEGANLVCKDTHYANLFKANPSELYINWAAAMQIQFHVSECDQEFQGTRCEWARAYLHHFVAKAKERAEYTIDKYVKPFLKYL